MCACVIGENGILAHQVLGFLARFPVYDAEGEEASEGSDGANCGACYGVV